MSEKGNQGTLGNLREYFWSYFDAGAQKNKAKEFSNVTYHPVPSSFEDSNLPILFIASPSELHLLTRPMNNMYTGMKEIWLDSDKWLDSCHVERETMHGGTFTVNASRTLLRNVDALQRICPT